MQPLALDHIAIYVPDRDALAAFLQSELGLRTIDRTERYTLVGVDALAGKLTLFDPPGEATPQPARLASVTLAAAEGTPERSPVECPGGLLVEFAPHPTATPGAVVAITLRSPDPRASADRYAAAFGFGDVAGGPGGRARVAIGDSSVVLVAEPLPQVTQDSLFHLGLLVTSADEHERGARERDIRVLNVVDAPNTLAVFVDGPDGVQLEYVEHKPSFALV